MYIQLSIYASNAKDRAIRRLANRVGRIDRLVRVSKADKSGRPPKGVESFPEGDWLLERAQALKIEDSKPKPIIMGRHLIELGFKPSPMFKKILDATYEAQLDGKFADTKGGKAYILEHFYDDYGPPYEAAKAIHNSQRKK